MISLNFFIPYIYACALKLAGAGYNSAAAYACYKVCVCYY